MIYIILSDGFEEIEALTPLDILRRGGCNVKTVSLNNTEYVRGSHNILIAADIKYDEMPDDIDMLVFPGGMPGSTNIDKSKKTDLLIEKALRSNAHIAAICAAPMILGKRGILKGKKAVCYPGFEEYLLGAEVTNDRVVTDKNVTTAIGMGAALEFAHELLKISADEKTADRIVGAVYPK